MNKLRFSSGMHIYIIISVALIAIGLILGLVMHFTSGMFFNWGGDYAGYRAVEVRYSVYDISEEEVKKAADDAFNANGVSYYTFVTSGESTQSRIEYRFAENQDAEKIAAATETIKAAVSIESDSTGYATAYSSFVAQRNSSADMTYAAIAVASAVVFQFLYFLIRYKLTMALAAFIADVHNLALFYALLAITRVQVSSSVVALSAFVVVATMILCAMMFDKMRKLFRTDDYKAMTSFAQADSAARASFPLVTLVSAVMFVAVLLVLVFASVAGGTVFGLFMPCACALIAIASAWYGTMFFTSSVYTRLKDRADKYNAAKKAKYVGAQKAVKAAD